jgi:outer membrane protein
MISEIKKYYLLLLLSAPGLLSAGTVRDEPVISDSLSLNTIISDVIQNHPMVKKAMEELTTSDAKIGIAQSGNLPTIDFASSYSRIGPISQITLPDVGTFSLMPHDNYVAAFNVNQTIFDFGKTENNVMIEKQGKELNLNSVEQVKQKLSQAAIGNYFALVYLQEAIKIKDEQLVILNEHLHYVQKKQETGTATQYEILTTQVRISVIENQKTDLETALNLQICQLNSLLGKPVNTSLKVKCELNQGQPNLGGDSLMATAMQNRDEMKLTREKAKLAEIRYSLTNSQNNPVINAFFSGGVKNGYIPYMYDPKGNFVAGVGIKVPIYDGKRNKYNLIQARSAIQINDQETEITRRTIINEVVESQANLNASQKKIDQSELQLRQAKQAYELAKVRFDSGVITNLELLEGSTFVSESRLMLLKAKIDYTVNIYKLKSATGERLY